MTHQERIRIEVLVEDIETAASNLIKAEKAQQQAHARLFGFLDALEKQTGGTAIVAAC
jgi:hypothetical protein